MCGDPEQSSSSGKCAYCHRAGEVDPEHRDQDRQGRYKADELDVQHRLIAGCEHHLHQHLPDDDDGEFPQPMREPMHVDTAINCNHAGGEGECGQRQQPRQQANSVGQQPGSAESEHGCNRQQNRLGGNRVRSIPRQPAQGQAGCQQRGEQGVEDSVRGSDRAAGGDCEHQDGGHLHDDQYDDRCGDVARSGAECAGRATREHPRAGDDAVGSCQPYRPECGVVLAVTARDGDHACGKCEIVEQSEPLRCWPEQPAPQSGGVRCGHGSRLGPGDTCITHDE